MRDYFEFFSQTVVFQAEQRASERERERERERKRERKREKELERGKDGEIE